VLHPVCLSVCPSVSWVRITGNWRNVNFGGHKTLDMSNWESKFEVKRSKVKVNESTKLNENGSFYTSSNIQRKCVVFVMLACLSVTYMLHHSRLECPRKFVFTPVITRVNGAII